VSISKLLIFYGVLVITANAAKYFFPERASWVGLAEASAAFVFVLLAFQYVRRSGILSFDPPDPSEMNLEEAQRLQRNARQRERRAAQRALEAQHRELQQAFEADRRALQQDMAEAIDEIQQELNVQRVSRPVRQRPQTPKPAPKQQPPPPSPPVVEAPSRWDRLVSDDDDVV
jgi:hypothetical protein